MVSAFEIPPVEFDEDDGSPELLPKLLILNLSDCMVRCATRITNRFMAGIDATLIPIYSSRLQVRLA